ncbi:MerR family transcriptional regulator [Acinetobacter seifertii]|uniref:MerR family transcriptional regulator n=1 Tax=Acinetobacter seifertii TaxID=1530123 RepID=A0A7H2P023_9GAMM|nr:MerR family transcriptional regulator [Acinetobacter seifertii]QNW96205.1 MerR family transcriptional regulator [Acinetobacter seifertii]QNX03369.1 MerR family transcriptional regulator [Acinetobacter seifertii]QNX10133.1 MerR family transcriptional regulator [Acinetobacter seifertii]QNX50222.1 MerR family transcriptional regulator [Acinetobacter seifertii]QNY18681.1 MerR family transcriptional regulator [Acinetobacter seifertii]
MNISELSKLSGLSTPTIRYYEQIKLLPKAKRKSNGYREYTDNDLKQLSLIQQAQQVGFSLAEIKAFLPSKVDTWNHDALIQTIELKIQEIELLEQKLKVSKQNLRTMIDAINNKPDEITCEQNAERLMNLYFDKAKTP